jgi:hypothetical protein
MTTMPTTKYAKSADVHVAYQVVGEGAQTLVLVPGWVSHIEYALFGLSEGGPMCLTFAATYPHRTSALLLYGTFARLLRAPDYPIGLPAELLGQFLEFVEESWGTRDSRVNGISMPSPPDRPVSP